MGRNNRNRRARPTTSVTPKPELESTSSSDNDSLAEDHEELSMTNETPGDSTLPANATPTSATPEDTNTLTPDQIAPTQVVAQEQQTQTISGDPTVTADPVVEDTEVIDDALIVDEDLNVVRLKTLLNKFAIANTVIGKKPEDFKESAKAALAITKYVIDHPKIPVLDVLLQFFKNNIDGVCQASNFMKGSQTLSNQDEQKVGYLHALFTDMAKQRTLALSTSSILTVLKKPEIVSYFNRKRASALAAKK